MKEDPCLRLRDVSLAYNRSDPDGLPVPWKLSRVTLNLGPGEILVVLGRSGIGKSTLLRAIMGFERPSRGESGTKVRIEVGGRLVDDGKDTFVPPYQRNVGVAFQGAAGLQLDATVFENVAFPLVGRRSQGLRSRVLSVMKRFQATDGPIDDNSLSQFSRRRVATLSGGQRQRVALSRCFVNPSRRLFLLDEPFVGQDRSMRTQLTSALRESLAEESSAGIVLVTHSHEEALALADLVVCLDDDSVRSRETRPVFVGSPTQLYLEPPTFLAASFLGLDSMNWLTKSKYLKQFPSLKNFGAVHVGVRPEHMTVVDGKVSPNGLVTFPVTEVDRQCTKGGTTITCTPADGTRWRVLTPFAPSTEVTRVGCTAALLHVFDKASGQRVSAGEK